MQRQGTVLQKTDRELHKACAEGWQPFSYQQNANDLLKNAK